MPDTPQEKLKAKLGAGLLVVRGSTYSFCPITDLQKCRMPEEFQEEFPGVAAKFFEKQNAGAGVDFNEKGVIHRELDRLFSQFWVADGLVQAIWIENAPTPAFTALNADTFIKDFQGAGLLASRDGVYFFIPSGRLKTLDNDPGWSDEKKAELDALLRQCRAVDGLEQAIWVNIKKPVSGKPASRTGGSEKIIFAYTQDEQKILVDMSKGGKPSSVY